MSALMKLAIATAVIGLGLGLFFFKDSYAQSDQPEKQGTPSHKLPEETVAKIATIHQIAQAEASQIKDLWKQFQKDDHYQTFILERWIQHNPLAAIDHTEKQNTAWRIWGESDGEAALTHAEKIQLQDMSPLLEGLARTDPHRVISLIKNNENITSSKALQNAIFRGLSRKNRKEAMDYLIQGPGVSDSELRSEVLNHWILSSPREALEWLIEHRHSYGLHCYGQTISLAQKTNPAVVNDLLETIPTGAFKKKFLIGRARADKIQDIQYPLTKTELMTTHRFIALVDEAGQVPPENFKKWLTKTRLGHLRQEKRRFIQNIILERWADIAPSECIKQLHFEYDLPLDIVFKKWLSTVPEAAMAYPASFEKRSSKRYTSSQQLTKALIEISITKAFEIIQRYPVAAQEFDQPAIIEILTKLAQKDRETIVRYIDNDNAFKDQAAKALVKAWLEKDLPWVVQTLQDLKLGPEAFNIPYYDLKLSGTTFLHRLPEFPIAWHAHILNSPHITHDCELEWLKTKQHPLIDTQILEKIQYRVARTQIRVHAKNREAWTELIHQSSWLSKRTRERMARAVVIGFSPDWTAAQKWVDTLPQEFAEEAQHSVTYFLREMESNSLYAHQFKPENFAQTLLSRGDFIRLPNEHFWENQDLEKIAHSIQTLTPREANRSLEKITYRKLPKELALAFIQRGILDEEERQPHQLRWLITEICQKEAIKEPAVAAKWAENLPEGEARQIALASVALEWKKYDRKEMRQWARTFPKKTTRFLGVYD